jgi:hypothetical protein
MSQLELKHTVLVAERSKTHTLDSMAIGTVRDILSAHFGRKKGTKEHHVFAV